MMKGQTIMKPKYTEGSWSISGRDEETSITVPDEHDDRFCTVIAVMTAHFPQQREANARLMASAPELLEQLKALVFCVEKYGLALPNGETTNLDYVKSVIAKAEGRE